MSLPTGSIDARGETPAGPDQRLPYPMQLGSGTFDLPIGLTYLGRSENWLWGSHASGTIRLGTNANDYRLGNRYQATVWGTRKLFGWLYSYVRIDGEAWRNIHGADPVLKAAMVPTADPQRRAGERVGVSFGMNIYASENRPKGSSLSIQWGLPTYQSLDGPQLETGWQLNTNAQCSMDMVTERIPSQLWFPQPLAKADMLFAPSQLQFCVLNLQSSADGQTGMARKRLRRLKIIGIF